MSDEQWATFSIYDHRQPLYRQALLLFDRIVVPIPTTPYADLTEAEIDALRADIEYLENHDAAVPFDWDPLTFQEWQKSVASEALAQTLSRDPLYATRLQLVDQALPLMPSGVDSVVAVPVYRDAATFHDSAEELRNDGLQDVLLLEVVLPRLPIPAADTPLQPLIDLRSSASFREATYNLRKWQAKVLPELIGNTAHREKHVRAAAADFDRWVKQYAEALSDANFAKIKTVVVSVLAVGAVLSPLTKPLVAALSAVASPLFSLRELHKPSWKIVSEKQCAPAAIVFESAKVM
jgi:hypothetical protein